MTLPKGEGLENDGLWEQVDRLAKQYEGLLLADGARAELEARLNEARMDIQQIEHQLTTMYTEAKAAKISHAINEWAPLVLLLQLPTCTRSFQ